MDVFDCTCENEYQDKVYGKHKRVFNDTLKGYRCTVCKKEKLTKDRSMTKKK